MSLEQDLKRAYVGTVNSIMRARFCCSISTLDVFCGAGGLSLGFKSVGFSVAGLDRDPWAVASYRANLGRADRRSLSIQSPFPEAEVLLAGPPCQPWSRAGGQLGEADPREGLAVVREAIRQANPRVAIVENVPEMRGDARPNHLDRFLDALRAMGYSATEAVLNAADFGVPQNRRRLFVFATLGAPLPLPQPHTRQLPARSAIGRLAIRVPPDVKWVTSEMDSYILRYETASKCRNPRDLMLDRASRTLTVRNLAGATGDMMRVRLSDGTRRRLSPREASRLQSFPDWFRFSGPESKAFEQIGNAVPPLLSRAIATEVLHWFERNAEPGSKP